MHEPGQPAPAADVAAVQNSLGRRLPASVVELYRAHDGGSWLEGNLQHMPMSGDELSVAQASDSHRSWGWPIPDEVVVFGSDGGGDPFGLWLPGDDARPVVVAVGQVFEPGSMGVVGADLNAFLLARTAYHLQLDDGTGPALDVLQVPAHLRSEDPDDDLFEAITAWASPGITGSTSDPYTALMTPDDVRRLTPSDGMLPPGDDGRVPFTHETTVHATPEAVVATLTDEAFVRAALADLGAEVREVSVEGPTTRARYSVATQGIPQAFAKFVGDRVEVLDVRTWTVDGDGATGTVLVTTSLFGRDVKLEGERRITGAATITSSGRSHVDAPFVGRKAEGAVDELAVVVLKKEAGTLAARLG